MSDVRFPSVSIIETCVSSSEHGLATHFIPSRRVPMLLERLAELERPHPSLVDRTIEELSEEPDRTSPSSPFTGPTRVALDYAFRHDTIEPILKDLETFSQSDNSDVATWASKTLSMLHMRSPTSLKVAIQAIRRGKKLSLLEALEMELRIATAFCVSYFLASCECRRHLTRNQERCKSRFYHWHPIRACEEGERRSPRLVSCHH